MSYNRKKENNFKKNLYKLCFVIAIVVAQFCNNNLEATEIWASTQTITVKGVSFRMVYVKSGTFTMGTNPMQGEEVSSYEKPTHKVTLSDYYIAETEVTQELWQVVMGNNPSHFIGNTLPVESVSWDDCQEFIKKLNKLTGKHFRMPTEAEWEYAARGGDKTCGYKYAGSNDLNQVAWYNDNSFNTTHQVATKVPNELGIYDMSGNVWEWCQDWYANYGNKFQTNPKGPSNGDYHVRRGGSWYYTMESCPVSYRYRNSPDDSFDLGFRLAIDAE